MKKAAVCLPAVMVFAGCSTPAATETTVAAVATVTAIAAETTTSGEHTHSAGDVWEWNGTQHWHVCECGETFDLVDYSVSEDMLCNVCGLEVWSYNDGFSDAIQYNDRGDIVKTASFDADGNVMNESVYEYEYNADGSIAFMMIYAYKYDADGNRTQMRTYDFDVLVSETEYMIEADTGFSYMCKMTEFLQDGTKTVYEYDSNEDLVKTTHYDANGKEIS